MLESLIYSDGLVSRHCKFSDNTLQVEGSQGETLLTCSNSRHTVRKRGYRLRERPEWLRVPGRCSVRDMDMFILTVSIRTYHDGFLFLALAAIAPTSADSNHVRDSGRLTTTKKSLEMEYTVHAISITACLYRCRMIILLVCFNCERSIFGPRFTIHFPSTPATCVCLAPLF